jgi:hypothetical protein
MSFLQLWEYQPFIPSPNERLGLLECLRVHFFTKKANHFNHIYLTLKIKNGKVFWIMPRQYQYSRFGVSVINT